MKKVNPIVKKLKGVKFVVSYDRRNKILSIITEFKKKKASNAFNVVEEEDFWNTIKINGEEYDINLYDNSDNDEADFKLAIYSLKGKGKTKSTDTSDFMRIPMHVGDIDGEDDSTPEEKKAFIRKDVEIVLLLNFALINMDKPENFDEILDFVTEDVYETSAEESEGYHSHGDIIIGFRRFIEREK